MEINELKEKYKPVIGDDDIDWHDFTMPVAIEISQRIAPFALWLFAADWKGKEQSTHGIAEDGRIAVITTQRNPHQTLSIVFHEAWHLCEALMNEQVLADLYKRFNVHGIEWHEEYYDDIRERCARAFANFGMMLLEGCSIATSGPTVTAEIKLFWYVYNGDFAKEIEKKRILANKKSVLNNYFNGGKK